MATPGQNTRLLYKYVSYHTLYGTICYQFCALCMLLLLLCNDVYIMPRLHQRNKLRATSCAQLDACCAQQVACCAQLVARNKLRWCKRGITSKQLKEKYTTKSLKLIKLLQLKIHTFQVNDEVVLLLVLS